MATKATGSWLQTTQALEHYLQSHGEKAQEELGLVARGDSAATRRVAEATGLAVQQLVDVFDVASRAAHRNYREDMIAKIIGNVIGKATRVHDGAQAGAGTATSRDLLLGKMNGSELLNLSQLSPLAGAEKLDDNHIATLAKKLDGGAITVVPISEPLHATPSGWLKLPADVTVAVVCAREAHLGAKLVPSLDGVSFEDLSKHIEKALAAEIDALHRGHGREEMAELQRLSSRSRQTFSAYLDPASGRVVVSEPSVPLPASVVVDAEKNHALLREMLESHASKATTDAVLGLLAEHLPTDVLNAARTANLTRMRLWERRNVLSDTAKGVEKVASVGAGAIVGGAVALATAGSLGVVPLAASLGAQVVTSIALRHGVAHSHPLAQALAPRSQRSVATTGEVELKRRTLDVEASKFLDPQVVAGCLTHELMHVLDYSLGVAGPASHEPEFVALWEKTRAACEAGEKTPGFVTTYSQTNRVEFFAECAVAYLNLQVEGVGRAVKISSRGDLLRQNPEVYTYFERIFSDRLPHAVKDGSILPSSLWIDPKLPADEARAKPEGDRKPEDWLSIAADLARRAVATNDPTLLDEATQACEHARRALGQAAKHLRVGTLFDALLSRWEIGRIESRLAHLKAGLSG